MDQTDIALAAQLAYEDAYVSDILEFANIVIASAYEGDWSEAPSVWRVAAERWLQDFQAERTSASHECLPFTCCGDRELK